MRQVKQVRRRVEAHLEVGGVYTHRLLAHSGLVGVARRLVVVREGTDALAAPFLRQYLYFVLVKRVN